MEYTRATHKEYFEYLDRLRNSGVVNMFGAGEYLRDAFGVDKPTSHAILNAWMETFGKDGANEED
jgi:hypothetical protein